MQMSRVWAMPDKNTFSIKPIGDLIESYIFGKSIDPFSNTNRLAEITNDIDPECNADHCMDALSFLKMFKDAEVDTVLYDPPYSPRQVSECYRSLGMSVNMQTTQSSFWGDMKKEISRIVAPSGVVVSCGWNSGGIGKMAGFSLVEVLLVPHGGAHNDTIVTVERKTSSQQRMFT